MKHSENNLMNIYSKKYLHLKTMGIQFGELYLMKHSENNLMNIHS